MNKQFQWSCPALSQRRIMAVGDPYWNARLSCKESIAERKPMKNIQMDYIILPFRQKFPEQAVVLKHAVLPARELIKPDAMSCEGGCKNAVPHLRRNNVNF